MPLPRRSRVAVILALLLIACVLPAPTLAADPTPIIEAPSAAPPVVDPTAPVTDPAAPPGEPAADPFDPTADGNPGVESASTPPGAPAMGDRYIVLLVDDANVTKALKRLEGKATFKAEHTFRHALKGFSATLSKGQRKKIAADPAVDAIVPDERIELAGQSIPTGVSRIFATQSDIAAIDGNDERVDADVAIVDTGIALHPDLNVVGGMNCSTSDPTAWRDQQSHGTHVAGIVGALDNDIGVVGVAPGVRLWAVKFLNDSGFGYISWYVCGLDWILAQRDPPTRLGRSSRRST